VDGTRSALIVASDQYADPGLRRLRAPASDAQALAGVLQNPEIGGFQVRTLLNQPAHEVNLALEEFFADRKPDDLLLVHVSSHGIKDEDGELYFAATNTQLRRLGATAVAAEFVNRRMSRTRSRRVVLLLDCCYAGAFERGMTARAGTGMGIEEQFGGRGRAVITASSAMEYAFEGEELADAGGASPSVFTSALVEGLESGEADRDQDGLVGLDELYDYVFDRVRAATPNQTPGRWMFGVQGDLYIARRARPVTTPAPLPPELQEAIDSPLTESRAGAVKHLARMLQSRHAGRALAARLALERLADDDSRMVCAAATEALDAAEAQLTPPEPVPPKLRVSTSVVDFGRLAEHSKSPDRRVRLGNAGSGSLNARGATQASWLELRQEGDELVIGVDTTMVGEHDGVVTVDSDGGSATIRVLVRVDPTPLPATTVQPDTGPATLEPARPGAEEATLPDASRTAPREPTVAAPMPAAPASRAEGPAASRTGPPGVYSPVPQSTAQPPGRTERATTAERGTQAGQARYDRRLRVAGGLAIAGGALMVVALFPAYSGSYRLVSFPSERWSTLIMAALALGAGACMLVPRMGRVIGPGLLLGVAAAAGWRVLTTATNYLIFKEYFAWGAGVWLFFAAVLIVVLAACLAGVALVRAGEVRVVPRLSAVPPLSADPFAWLVALLGGAGAVVFFLYQLGYATGDWGLVARMWVPAMALVVPASAAVAVPRRFGAALLAGWIGGGAAIALAHFFGDPAGRVQILLFAGTLLALLLVSVPFARHSDLSAERTP
jgi:hypothetical protein